MRRLRSGKSTFRRSSAAERCRRWPAMSRESRHRPASPDRSHTRQDRQAPRERSCVRPCGPREPRDPRLQGDGGGYRARRRTDSAHWTCRRAECRSFRLRRNRTCLRTRFRAPVRSLRRNQCSSPRGAFQEPGKRAPTTTRQNAGRLRSFWPRRDRRIRS